MRAVAVAWGSFVLVAALAVAAPAQQRNLLIVVADDLGVDYVGAYKEGTNPPPTPNIDALAARGVLFRNAWSHPSCSPTRAAVLTGRHPFRTTVGRWISFPNNRSPEIGTLADEEWTIPEVLDRANSGYAHACVGKWHIHDYTFGLDAPRRLGGFRHFAGSLEGQIPNYTNWVRVVDGVAAPTTNYCTIQNTDDALAWIGRQTGPWVLYLTYQAPHIPYHAPPASLHTQNLTGLTPQPTTHTPANRPFYRAMVESLDTELGRLFTRIGAATLGRTNVVFLGDNGSVQQQAVAPFDPSRAKGTPYEGGINVPLIVAGPDVVSGGREVTALACSVDVFATALELTGSGGALPEHVEHDSVSLVPYLRNPNQSPLRSFAFSEEFTGATWPSPNLNGYAMVRDSRYKLIRRMTAADELFDLQLDPFESSNLLQRPLTPQETQAHAALLNEIARLRTPKAAVVPYGKSACLGQNGVPSLAARGVPALGASFELLLQGAAGGVAAALLVGVSMATWNGAPLPIDLSPWGGGSGCLIGSSGEAMAFATTSS
ncbi:MAG: sulfatase-like hydrolase/transferase, partial [Planctomycetes bacterium]|nr:sulfatase-like hydrolase/transferase [Planctomycetota bacterium]